MIEAASLSVSFLAALVMSTLGAVLLTGFFLGHLDRSVRVLCAAVLGPGLVILPMLGLMANRPGSDAFIIGLIAIGVMVAVSGVIIGWPVAFVATKRFDRMTQFDAETFE